MWIICGGRKAINTDYVSEFRQDGSTVMASMVGMQSTYVGKTTVKEILENIISGVNIVEVN